MRIAVSESHSLVRSTMVSDWIARHSDIDEAFVLSMVPAVREALDRLDSLAFVPQSDRWPVGMEDDGIRPVTTPTGPKWMPFSSRFIVNADSTFCRN